MEREYNPLIDNYALSIPSKPHEEWRNNLQILYENMKLTVVDPIVIDEQYFDMHDEFSDAREDNFNTSEGKVIVGIRRLVYAEFIPKFLELHLKFLEAVSRLSPEAKISMEARSEIAQDILRNYKVLIDHIHKIHERGEINLEEILEKVPDEFGLRRIIETTFSRYGEHINCFRYPRCNWLATKDFSASLGDYVLFKELTDGLNPKEIMFLPADAPYCEDVYPGFLDSYKSRIRFAAEVLEKADLTRFREHKMTNLLLGKNSLACLFNYFLTRTYTFFPSISLGASILAPEPNLVIVFSNNPIISSSK